MLILGVTMIVMFFVFLFLDWIHNLGIDSFQTTLKMAPGNGKRVKEVCPHPEKEKAK